VQELSAELTGIGAIKTVGSLIIVSLIVVIIVIIVVVIITVPRFICVHVCVFLCLSCHTAVHMCWLYYCNTVRWT